MKCYDVLIATFISFQCFVLQISTLHVLHPCAFAGDLNLIKVPSDLTDNQVLFLSDILATGWHAAELGNVHEGDKVAIWGTGPGQIWLHLLLFQTTHPAFSRIATCAVGM